MTVLFAEQPFSMLAVQNASREKERCAKPVDNDLGTQISLIPKQISHWLRNALVYTARVGECNNMASKSLFSIDNDLNMMQDSDGSMQYCPSHNFSRIHISGHFCAAGMAKAY